MHEVRAKLPCRITNVKWLYRKRTTVLLTVRQYQTSARSLALVRVWACTAHVIAFLWLFVGVFVGVRKFRTSSSCPIHRTMRKRRRQRARSLGRVWCELERSCDFDILKHNNKKCVSARVCTCARFGTNLYLVFVQDKVPMNFWTDRDSS